MKQKGFTLVELVIVIAIISTLACIAIPRFTQAADSAGILKARTDLISIDGAIAAYFMNTSASGLNLSPSQLVAAGFLTSEPKPPIRLLGFTTDKNYQIDGVRNRAYLTLSTAGKTVQFYSDTVLNE